MSFVEFRFLWFFLLLFIVYWTMRYNIARKVWLLLCSYVFYAAWNWKFTFLLLGSTTVDYIVGRMLARCKSRGWRRLWIATSVCANLGVLVFSNTSIFSSLRRPSFWRGSAYRQA